MAFLFFSGRAICFVFLFRPVSSAQPEGKSMKRIMIWIVFAAWMIVFFLSPLPGPAFGHGTGHHILSPESAVAVEFFYSDNQPMRYAEVLVFSPENDEVEYQNGRTDINGRFVFYPNSAGKWHIQANDGTGHLERVSVDIDREKEGDSEGQGFAGISGTHGHDHSHYSLPRAWAILLGASLIANVFLGLYLIRSTSKTKSA